MQQEGAVWEPAYGMQETPNGFGNVRDLCSVPQHQRSAISFDETGHAAIRVHVGVDQMVAGGLARHLDDREFSHDSFASKNTVGQQGNIVRSGASSLAYATLPSRPPTDQGTFT